MTKPEQKDRELQIVKQYLEDRGLSGVLVPNEAPDFVLMLDCGSIGIEVLEYHQPKTSEQPFPRLQVEAEWRRIRNFVARYRKPHRDLDDVCVWLAFRALRVPSRQETAAFVEGVHGEVRRVRHQLTGEPLSVAIGSDHPELLRKYLKKILVHHAGCYIEWSWNHDVGGVGTDESELLSILSPKLQLKRPAEVSELHLLLFGIGNSVGTFIGLLLPEQLARWHQLNAALDKSAFDVVAIRSDDLVVWQREIGWSVVDSRSERS